MHLFIYIYIFQVKFLSTFLFWLKYNFWYFFFFTTVTNFFTEGNTQLITLYLMCVLGFNCGCSLLFPQQRGESSHTFTNWFLLIKLCPSLNFVHLKKQRSRASWGGSGGVYPSSATWGGTTSHKPRRLTKMAPKILHSFPETAELSPSCRLRPPCFDQRFTQEDDFIDISFNRTGSEPVSCWTACCRSVSSHHTVPAEVIPEETCISCLIIICADIWRHTRRYMMIYWHYTPIL